MDRRVSIGLVVLLAIGLLYAGLAWVLNAGVFAGGTTTYRVKLEDAQGLKLQDAVSVFGLDVGHVSQMQVQADGIEVWFALPDSLLLHPDARAEVRMHELLSGKQLVLWPGRQPGKLAPMAFVATQQGADVQSLVYQLGTQLQGLPPGSLGRLLSRLDTLAGMAIPAANSSLLAQLQHTLMVLSNGANQLAGLLAQADRQNLLGTAGETLQQLGTSLKLADSTLTSLTRLSQSATQRLPQLDSLGLNVLRTTYGLQELTANLNASLNDSTSLLNMLAHDPKSRTQVQDLMTQLRAALLLLQRGQLEIYVRLGKVRKHPDE